MGGESTSLLGRYGLLSELDTSQGAIQADGIKAEVLNHGVHPNPPEGLLGHR